MALMKDADIYLFDEPSSYLDINERIRISEIIRKLAETKIVMVVEHDLALLDKIADQINLVYGSPGAYGVITKEKSTNKAINAFLSGYLREENVRIRPTSIDFNVKSSKRTTVTTKITSWTNLEKKFENFELHVGSGYINKEEIIGVLGQNALGKTTFIKMLSGTIKPDSGQVENQLRVAYKPQYISPDFDGTVYELFSTTMKEKMEDQFIKNEIIGPLDVEELYDKNVNDLSGGELQRTSVALTLSTDADIYLIDEPSAHLDSAYRMNVAKIIRRVMENNKKVQ